MAYTTVQRLRRYLRQVPVWQEQLLTPTGSPAGGTTKIAHEGVASAAIAYPTRSVDLKTALEAISTIGEGGIDKVEGPYGGPWAVTFVQALGGVPLGQSPLVLAENHLTGGTAPSITIESVSTIVMQDILNSATDIVEGALHPIAFTGYTTEARRVTSYGGPLLYLPAHQAGSITSITLDGSTVEEEDYAETTEGAVYMQTGWAPYERSTIRRDFPEYLVTADWGYGDPPDRIIEVVLQIAVNMWKSKDASHFSDVVGVEGGAVGYEKALTGQQKMVIEDIKREFLPKVIV